MEEDKTSSYTQNYTSAQSLLHGHTLLNRLVICLFIFYSIYIISGIVLLFFNPRLIVQFSIVEILFGWLSVIFGLFIKLPVVTSIAVIIDLLLCTAYLFSSDKFFLYWYGVLNCYFSPLSFLLILSI